MIERLDRAAVTTTYNEETTMTLRDTLALMEAVMKGDAAARRQLSDLAEEQEVAGLAELLRRPDARDTHGGELPRPEDVAGYAGAAELVSEVLGALWVGDGAIDPNKEWGSETPMEIAVLLMRSGLGPKEGT